MSTKRKRSTPIARKEVNKQTVIQVRQTHQRLNLNVNDLLIGDLVYFAYDEQEDANSENDESVNKYWGIVIFINSQSGNEPVRFSIMNLEFPYIIPTPIDKCIFFNHYTYGNYSVTLHLPPPGLNYETNIWNDR